MHLFHGAALMLVLSASLAWAGDRSRPTFSPVRAKSSEPAMTNPRLQNALDRRNQTSQIASNVLRRQSEINRTFARNIR